MADEARAVGGRKYRRRQRLPYPRGIVIRMSPMFRRHAEHDYYLWHAADRLRR